MENSSMVRIPPVGSLSGAQWDDKGGTEIVQIFVSHDDKIHSLQFQHAKENGELVLSDMHGLNDGKKFNVVRLNYPSEYIISISGKYGKVGGIDGIASITFGTNLGTHGPFGDPSTSDLQDFMLHLGSERQFGGFHGYADNVSVRAIGLYVKPISTL